MSKLIEKLARVGTIAPTRLGFGANRTQEKVPSLFVLGLCGAKSLQSHPQLHLDSVVILTDTLSQPEIETAKSIAGDIIWGLWPENPDGNSLDSLKSSGGDFFVLPTVDMPAALLAAEELGRLVVLPTDFPEELGHTLEELPIDAIILSGLEEVAPLSIRDLMQIRSIRDLTSKPIMLVRSRPLTEEELEVLQEAGIQGVVLDLRSMNVENAAQISEDIQGLPPRKTKRDQADALLPRLSSQIVSPHEEEEDGEEDY